MTQKAIRAAFFVWWTACAWQANAHPALEEYLQQRVGMTVSPQNVDVTIEFTFNSPASLAERQRMDTDRNGRLSKAERRAYLKEIEERADKALRLEIDGAQCDLIPLYDPELDFYDSRDLEAHPHVLRLFYFARTPASFHSGSNLALVNRLWAGVPCLVLARVQGKGGVQLRAVSTPAPKALTKRVGIEPVLEAQCTTLERRGP